MPRKIIPSKSIYLGNPLLKAAGVPMDFTQEQIEEYARCAKDPVYFVENYVKIVSLDRGLIPFEVWPFQKKMIRTFHNERLVIVKCGRQSGKCVTANVNVTVRNKKTGKIFKRHIGNFFEKIKNN